MYEDNVYLKKFNEQNKIQLDPKIESERQYINVESAQRFFAICKTATSKPYWYGYSESQSHLQTKNLHQYLSHTFKQAFVTSEQLAYTGDNISCHFLPWGKNLPKFLTMDQDTKEMSEKSYKVPANFEMEKILEYLYNQLNVKEHILDTDRDNQKASDHLAFAL